MIILAVECIRRCNGGIPDAATLPTISTAHYCKNQIHRSLRQREPPLLQCYLAGHTDMPCQ